MIYRKSYLWVINNFIFSLFWEVLLFLLYLPCLILFWGHRHSYFGVDNFINILFDLYILCAEKSSCPWDYCTVVFDYFKTCSLMFRLGLCHLEFIFANNETVKPPEWPKRLLFLPGWCVICLFSSAPAFAVAFILATLMRLPRSRHLSAVHVCFEVWL